jgi:protein TonB
MQLRDSHTISADAAPGPERAAPESCPIVALSDDPLLLEALAGLSVAGTGVMSSPSSDRFIDQLVANSAGAGIAIIDAASVSSSLKGFLATLREQFPQLLVMLTGPAHLQAQFEEQITDGTIFRFLHRPASSQRLRLFIDAALRKLATPEPAAGKARAVSAAAAAPPIALPVATPYTARPMAPQPPIHQRRGFPFKFVLLGLAILGAAAWALWHYEFAPATDLPALPEPPTASETLSEPSNTTNPPPDAAATLLPGTDKPNTADAARDGTLHDGAARDAARAAAQLEQAQRNAQGARADQVALYVQLARKRLASGALIDPADDNARGYLESATSLAPDDPDVRAASIALGEAMIVQFRHAIAAGDLAESQRWFKACSDYRIGSATLSDLSAQLQKLQSAQQNEADSAVAQGPERAHAAAPAVPPPSIATPATVTATAPIPTPIPTPAVAPPAAPSSGTPAAEPAQTWVPESTLTRVLFVPPSYPDEALSRNIGGWVDLEFTVTPEGNVTDVAVLAAEPSGVFDRAARGALSRSRYRPVTRDGVPVAQRARIRVRFKQ